jgi:hypothetical protein
MRERQKGVGGGLCCHNFEEVVMQAPCYILFSESSRKKAFGIVPIRSRGPWEVVKMVDSWGQKAD